MGFVAKLPYCQQVKVEHQRWGGFLQDIIILDWKWEEVNVYFIMGLPRSRRQHVSVWVTVDTMRRSAHYFSRHSFTFGGRL